jgi:Ser/Thr protein kinase RdoA (MazF antagonist)
VSVALPMDCVERFPNLGRITAMFDIPGHLVSCTAIKTGHINDTFAVTHEHHLELRSYLLQRINEHVFRDVDALMSNIARVTKHVRAKLAARQAADIDRRALVLVPSRSGQDYVRDQAGRAWRVYQFIGGAHTHETLGRLEDAFETARAFGRFQCELEDLDGARLHETIPDFHNTPKRFQALLDAVEADRCNRVTGVARELSFVLERTTLARRLVELQASGDLPERVTHNDTKVNNVLLDDATGEGLCVVDLDTVMPGLSLYDFGDLVRSAVSPAAEDEVDLTRVTVDVSRFKALTLGYLAGLGGALLPLERANLIGAGMLLTYECGVRFLTDHLEGDVYFRTHRPEQNRDRARAQLALVGALEQHEGPLQRWVESLDAEAFSSREVAVRLCRERS